MNEEFNEKLKNISADLEKLAPNRKSIQQYEEATVRAEVRNKRNETRNLKIKKKLKYEIKTNRKPKRVSQIHVKQRTKWIQNSKKLRTRGNKKRNELKIETNITIKTNKHRARAFNDTLDGIKKYLTSTYRELTGIKDAEAPLHAENSEE